MTTDEQIAQQETRKCAIALFNDETDSRSGTILAHIKSAIAEALNQHRCGLPNSINEALNSGDGVYRP